MKRAKTSIPIPEVHSYCLDLTNDVGAPYILMDYIHGTVATELQEAKKCDAHLFGTQDQDRKFRQQMADIQVKLSSFTFDQIGSLYQDEQTSDFFIGPDVETGKGPWASSMDYYTDLANHVLQVCVRSAEPEVQKSVSFTIPCVFQHLIFLYSQSRSMGGPSSLVNRDFGAHNLLVNDNFEIIGVIDLDGVMAAPMEVVAQYPVLTGLDTEPPGHVETKPAAIDRIRVTEPKLKEYKDLIGTAEAEMNGDEGDTPIANLMLSDATNVFQGLLSYRCHQKFVNDNWMEAYARLLHSYYMRDMGVTGIPTAILDTDG